MVACAISFIACVTHLNNSERMLDLFVHRGGNIIKKEAVYIYDKNCIMEIKAG